MDMLKTAIAKLAHGFALLAALALPGTSPAGDALRIGVAPHSSARIVIAQYQPVREALQGALGTPAEVVTARDFTDFAKRALALDYDIAVTTAHQAALLRNDAGFVPLVTYRADFEALAVAAGDSGVRSAGDLQNQPVLGLNAASLVTLWGSDWLHGQRVKPRSFGYITASDSVAELVLRHEAAAGFMSLANFQKLSPEERARLRVIARSGPMPGRVYLLSPRLAGREEAIRAALSDFARSEAGQHYFAENQLGGYRPVGRAELDAMRGYADKVRRQLRDE